jgi:hypothetical protein
MATIKKTITGLKPATNYLFSLKPKNTEISAIDATPDTIRVQTPGIASTPSSITGVLLAANYKSAMLRFNHASIIDLDYYEYKIYLANDLTETALKARPSTVDAENISGISKSNLVVISDLDNTNLIDNVTTTISYKAKVRAVNTGGKAGAWSSASNSSATELIESQFILDLTAAKITAGTIGAEEIILSNYATPSTNYTPPAGMAVLRSSDYVAGSAGWIIKGDGTAEFGSASIRGVLSAKSIHINEFNRWGRNAANTADETDVFVVGKDANSQIYWNGSTLTVKGSLITGNQVSGGTVGGVSVGSSSIHITDSGTTAAYESANTGFYVDSTGRFSLRDKFKWNGSSLIIDGSVTIGSTAASTVVSNASTGASDPATRINGGATTISGNKIRTGSIDSTNLNWNGATLYAVAGTRIDLDGGQIVSKNFRIDSSGNATFGGAVTGATITGGTINSNNNLFKVDGSGNAFANNIYATGASGDFGLQIRADGNPITGIPNFSTNGAIWILSGSGKETKIGNTQGSLNVRYRAAAPNIPEAVVIEPAYFTGSVWSQQRNFEINMAKDYNFYVNTDVILRGSALDGSGNDYFTDDASVLSGGQDARYVQGTYKGRVMWIISRDGSSIRYKENVESVSNDEALNSINKLKLKKFTYKRNEKFDTEDSYKFKQLDYDYGFIAEEVAEVMPWLATYTITEAGKEKIQSNFEDEDLNNPDYVQVENWKRYAVVSMLVGSVQSLNKRIESLEAQLAAQ